MLLKHCMHCSNLISVSAGSSHICDDCNGTNERKRLTRAQEAERWAKLSDSQKIEELLQRIEYLEERSRQKPWDGRIG